MPQLQEDREDFNFQEDGAPLQFRFDFRAHLNADLPGLCIRRDSDNDSSLIPWPPLSPDLTPYDFFLGVASRIVCTCPLCHVIYHSCNKWLWRQSLLSTVRCCNVCDRNLIIGLTSDASSRVDISSTCKVGQKLGVFIPLVTYPPFVTIRVPVMQNSEIPERFMNYPVVFLTEH
jgi:hypothetical protein